jgi:hypothetical protein
MPRIADYAFLGDLHTGILVSCQGSVDWCCFPRFDSAACFAALLGAPDHGRWLMAPVDPASRSSRLFRADTLILETLYETPEGAVRVIDFMPPRGDAPDIVRIVEGVRGVVAMRSELVVRFDYGRVVPWVWKLDDVWVAIAGPDPPVCERRSRRTAKTSPPCPSSPYPPGTGCRSLSRGIRHTNPFPQPSIPRLLWRRQQRSGGTGRNGPPLAGDMLRRSGSRSAYSTP